jgi:hypothetical protein
VKPSFRFGGLVGEIAIEVNVAVTFPVVVVFEDVVAEEPDEHADAARVKSVINPITRQ